MRNPFRWYGESKSFDALPEDLWQRILIAQDLAGTMSIEQAVGLPAVLAVVRLISHAVGLIPLNVIRGDETAERTRAVGTWQWNLLHRRPGPPPTTPANFKMDLAAHFCGYGNAYVRKIKPLRPAARMTRDTPRVTELLPVHPAYITPRRIATGIAYDDSSAVLMAQRGTDEIIQARSFSVTRDGLLGLSPISSTRMMISAGLKRQQFEDRHLSNGIFPGMAVEFPKGMTQEQGARWLDFMETRHRGSGRAGKAVGVPSGANLTTLPISLEDALFAEMTRITGEQACAMWQVPLALLTRATRPITDDDWRHFQAFAVAPVVNGLAEAFTADDDLFAPGEDDDLSVESDPDALLRLDPLKRAQVEHAQIQDGTRLVDELRAAAGLGPLPAVPEDWTQTPGKVPQITPVGGAPNPIASTDKPIADAVAPASTEGGPDNGSE